MNKISMFIVVGCLWLACKKNVVPSDPIPAHDTFTIETKQEREIRTINVWTPPVYAQHNDSLPVMYMPDGGIGEDFPHIANTMAALIESKRIPPMILVGIENTQRRRDLSGPTEVEEDKKIAPVVGGSTQFRAFVKEELFPEINSRYRTNPQKGIIGESLAGLFIVETFFTDPQMFDYYIAMDPSLWWNNHHLVELAKVKLPKLDDHKTRFWFAGSSVGDINPFTNELAGILETAKVKNLEWKYSDEPKEEHSTIYRATKEKALIWALHEKPQMNLYITGSLFNAIQKAILLQ